MRFMVQRLGAAAALWCSGSVAQRLGGTALCGSVALGLKYDVSF